MTIPLIKLYGKVIYCKDWITKEDPIYIESVNLLKRWANKNFKVKNEIIISRYYYFIKNELIPREFFTDDKDSHKITSIGIKFDGIIEKGTH